MRVDPSASFGSHGVCVRKLCKCPHSMRVAIAAICTDVLAPKRLEWRPIKFSIKLFSVLGEYYMETCIRFSCNTRVMSGGNGQRGPCKNRDQPCETEWRRDRDSNPGDGFPPTRFPSVRLRPLGHLSVLATISQLCDRLQEIVFRSRNADLKGGNRIAEESLPSNAPGRIERATWR